MHSSQSNLSIGRPLQHHLQVLAKQLVRMAQDHPYHALYPLFALKNGAQL